MFQQNKRKNKEPKTRDQGNNKLNTEDQSQDDNCVAGLKKQPVQWDISMRKRGIGEGTNR